MHRSEFIRLTAAAAVPVLGHTSLAAPAETLRIGVLTDCQYADVDTPPKSKRLYRKSPQKLQAAVDHLNAMGDLDFAIHLGDLIDRDTASFAPVMKIFRQLRCPRYQVLGNHDYSVEPAELVQVLPNMELASGHFAWSQKGWRFIVLDGNAVSLFAYPKDSEAWKAAKAIQEKSGRKLPEWGGGLGEAQRTWLRRELVESKAAGRPVALFCHYPLLPLDAHSLWDAEETLALLQEFPGTVRLWANGHNHDGNYAARHGIHFVNFHGMVDTERNAYARLELSATHGSITGFGREPSRFLPWPAADSPTPKPPQGRAN